MNNEYIGSKVVHRPTYSQLTDQDPVPKHIPNRSVGSNSIVSGSSFNVNMRGSLASSANDDLMFRKGGVRDSKSRSKIDIPSEHESKNSGASDPVKSDDSNEALKKEQNKGQKDVDESDLEYEFEEESREALGYLHAMEQCPCFIIMTMIVVSIFCLVWVVYYDLLHYDAPDERSWLKFNEDTTKKYDKVYLAEQDIFQIKDENKNALVPLNTQIEKTWKAHLIFKEKDEDGMIFTSRNIRRMRQISEKARLFEGHEGFCIAQSADDRDCSRSEYMNGAIFSIGENLNENTISSKLRDLAEDHEYQPYFSSDFTSAKTNTRLTRVTFTYALPLQVGDHRYEDMFDDFEEQEEHFEEFTKELGNYIEGNIIPYESQMDVYFYSDLFYEIEWLREVYDDVEFTTGSIVFSFLYMIYHTRSLFIALFGIIEILFSLPIGYMAYSQGLGLEYVGPLHLITIYVIIGLTTNNMYAFMDTWRHSKKHRRVRRGLHIRMTYTFYRAIKPIAISTIITIVAFVGPALSKIVPIATFGFGSLVLIVTNFIFMLTVFPAGVIFYSKYIEKPCDCVDCIKKLIQSQDELKKHLDDELPEEMEKREKNLEQMAIEGIMAHLAGTEAKESSESSDDHHEEKKEKTQKWFHDKKTGKLKNKYVSTRKGKIEFRDQKIDQDLKYGCFETFFEKGLGKFLNSSKAILPLFFLGWMGYMIYCCVEMEGLKKPEEFLPDSFQVTEGRKLVQTGFRTGEGDLSVKLRLVWGIDGVDKENSTNYDLAYLGKVKWDDTFDISTPTNQQWLEDNICKSGLASIFDSIKDPQSIICFLDDFLDHAATYPSSYREGKYVKADKFKEVLINFTKTNDKGKFYLRDHQLGLDNEGNLRFMQVIAYIEAKPFGIENSKIKELNTKWEATMNNILKTAPEGLKNGFETGMYSSAFVYTEGELYINVVVGLSLSLAGCFITICAFTMNYIVAIYASFTLIEILLSNMGIIYIIGWEFGLIECIMTVVTVAYIIHYEVLIACNYLASPYYDRKRRTDDALRKCGVSIFGHAATVVGSTLFLYWCVFLVVEKFASLVLFAIFFALIFAFLFFPSLLYLGGPEGSTGDFRACCCKTWIRKAEENNLDYKMEDEAKEEEINNMFDNVVRVSQDLEMGDDSDDRGI